MQYLIYTPSMIDLIGIINYLTKYMSEQIIRPNRIE